MTEADWLSCSDPAVMLGFLSTTGKLSERKARLFCVACCRRVWRLLQLPGEEDLRSAADAIEQLADGNVTPDALAALRRGLLSHPIAGCPAGYDLNQAAQPFWAPIAAVEFSVLAVAHGVGDPVDPVEAARLAAFAEAADWFSERGPAYASAHLADHVGRLGSDAAATFAASFRRGAALYRKQVLTERGWEWEEESEVEEANGYAVLSTLADVREAQVVLVRDLFGNPFRPVPAEPTWRTLDVLALARAAYEGGFPDSGFLDPGDLAVLADALEDAGCTSPDVLGHLRGPGPHVRGCWAVDALLGKS